MARSDDTRIEAFGFRPGRVLKGKYEVVAALGSGWEGEVYLVRERATGIERTAKLFFPHRNPRQRASRLTARKLERLRGCPIMIPYHAQETMHLRGLPVTFLLSDYVRGERLSKFLARRPGGRLEPFAALHLLYALACGLDCIHRAGEYHGDLHTDNVIVERFGLGFELKLIDLFHWQASKRECMRHDIVEMVRIFYEALGGRAAYRDQPPEVKAICRGMRRSLILERFRTAGHLKAHLEALRWS